MTECGTRERAFTERRTAILVAHTHWDRAWYLPFQQFRIRLVRLIDTLLETLEREPDFRYFTLDGQMVVIEDYLEVRPERRADLERFVREERLLVGPWYVLPDEFLVSPESLIRNLEMGIRLAAPFGGHMAVGYEPDAFGHIAQLPQIAAGFGIDNVVFWRGLGDEARELGTEFWWVAPDGTRALAIWLAAGYSAFEYLGYPHRGDEANMPFRLEWAMEKLEGGISRLASLSPTSCLLLMAGVDHEDVNLRLPEIVRRARSALPGVEVRMGTLPQLVDCVRAAGGNLKEYPGEMRWGATAYALQQVYSARMYLKQRNNRCQTLLERYAEPFIAFASTLGAPSNQAFLDLAWRELLKNHPHDDICGCSVDPVHRQMEARFDSVEQVGEVLVRDAVRYLTGRVTLRNDEQLPLFVFNPNTRAYRGTAATTLRLPRELGSFSIYDEDGKPVPYQEIGRRTGIDMEVNRPRPTLFVDALLALPEVPPCGYRTLSFGPPGEVPASDLSVSGTSMQNEHLSVTVNGDGTIDLTDRDTGASFAGLHALEDAEDAGDEYTYAPAPEGRTLTSADADVEVEPLAEGPVRAGFRIRYRLALPRSLAPDGLRRSDETVEYLVTTDVWLGTGERRLELVTRVDNMARDHRLRVRFPTGLRVDAVHIDGHFDVVERPVTLPEGRGWREPPSPTAHQRAFVDVSDGRVGLGIFNQGLPEYEATETANGVEIALTLLRCVGWLSRDSMATRPGPAGPHLETPGAQCPGEYEFRYAVAPHRGGWEEIVHQAHAFNAPCEIVAGRTTPGILPSDVESPDHPWEALARSPELDVLPERASFLTLKPAELILSSVRRERNGEALIIRCYNPTNRAVASRLRLLWPVRAASLVNFLGAVQQDLSVQDEAVSFDAPAHGIITLRCLLARSENAESGLTRPRTASGYQGPSSCFTDTR